MKDESIIEIVESLNFTEADFRDPLCIGEMRGVFERITAQANKLIEDRLYEHFNKFDPPTDFQLRRAASKLFAIGHLIESSDPNRLTPLYQNEVDTGLGLLITEIGEILRNLANKMEANEIKTSEPS